MKENSVLGDYENMVARLEKREGLDSSKPAWSYQYFLEEAQKLFIQKSTDYEDRYLKGLVDLNARTIWTWEVEKKLDRLRSWIKRGELQVKDEGIRNSVDDLFIYTVQYVAYIQEVVNSGIDENVFLSNAKNYRASFFWEYAHKLKPGEWVEFLESKGLIKQEELLLKNIIRSYMGENIETTDWKQAIKAILS
ncbi:hypothetical protein [Cytobacillus praedii]|uniref:hypothetical protein n=1 Tax=Cytobacillus praedii TaxID=1742358 RepID=UPI002E1AEEA2|nr:hypothetical protein [Cytobacillus praedii]